ncbi:MAG TPA: hypothetical protein VJH96_00765 [Patescibacteria group bacterium]|nr:hypothetical protein [Patescibacteria group bacterium]
MFLQKKLLLAINPKNDVIIKARWGLNFLGVEIFPSGRRLNKRNWHRAQTRLNQTNISSYSGLIAQHSKRKRIKEFRWIVLEKIGEIE